MPRVVREELHVSDIESDSDDELEQELAKLRKALAPREVWTVLPSRGNVAFA